MPREECARKVQLLADIQGAMGVLMAIHNEEVNALLAEEFDRIAELRATLQWRENAKRNWSSCIGNMSSATAARRPKYKSMKREPNSGTLTHASP